ncbi:MAG: hypothetical protein ACOVS5_16085 [Oligoflexus sp.]|jgi:hypothetical protein
MGVTLTKPLLTFLLTSILGAGLAYGGGAPPNDTDAEFQYGGPCSQLTRLSYLEMSSLVHRAHSEQFARFCTPENVYTCADYSQLVESFGSLGENGSVGCRFVPERP